MSYINNKSKNCGLINVVGCLRYANFNARQRWAAEAQRYVAWPQFIWNRPNVSPDSMAEESDTSKVTQNESDSRSHVVDGLLSMIQPVIYETDLRVVGVR